MKGLIVFLISLSFASAEPPQIKRGPQPLKHDDKTNPPTTDKKPPHQSPEQLLQNRAMLKKGAFEIEMKISTIFPTGFTGTAKITAEDGTSRTAEIFMETPTARPGLDKVSTYHFTARSMGTGRFESGKGPARSMEKFKDIELILWQLEHPGQEHP